MLILTTAIALPLLTFVVNAGRQFLAIKVEEKVRMGIEADKNYAFEQVNQVSKIGRLQASIIADEQLEVVSMLSDEASKRGLPAMVGVNAAGIAVARYPFVSNRGDVVSQTTVWGRSAAKGQPIVTVDIGRSFPLTLTAAHPFFGNEGQVLGAVYGGYLLNDSYAERLKEQNLLGKDRIELIIYSENEGVIGTTVEDDSTKALLAAHFNSGTDFVKKRITGHYVRIGFDEYTVRNIVFDSESGRSVGGVMVLIPRDQAYQRGLISILLTILFIVCFLYLRGKPLHSMTVGRWGLVIAVAITSYSLTTFVYGLVLGVRIVDITKQSNTIYNSVLGFSPNVETVGVGENKQVSIRLASGGESINAVQFGLKFDPGVIVIEDIVVGSDSICRQDLVTDKLVNNTAGIIVFGCGLPTPGFGYGIGTIAQLTLRANNIGETAIRFDDVVTRVLANDGLGTDVLRTAAPGYIRVVGRSSLTQDNPTEVSAGSNVVIAPPIVFSQSHPSSALWVAERLLKFHWPAVPGAESYLYRLDQSPISTTENLEVLSKTETEIQVTGDGVYYFHLFARKDGQLSIAANYKVMVDTTEPTPPIVKASETKVVAGSTVRFHFSSTDSTSGLQKKFYSKVYLAGKEEGIRLPASEDQSIVFPRSGKYIIEVRAFDNAGNYSDSQETIVVAANSFLQRVVDFIASAFN